MSLLAVHALTFQNRYTARITTMFLLASSTYRLAIKDNVCESSTYFISTTDTVMCINPLFYMLLWI